jgi:LPXTG-motif cell wall-anchored protein
LTYDVTVSGVSPNLVTAAHIHKGARGVNGPVVYFISPTGFTQVSGTIALTPADEADLRAGNWYLNVHTVAHPGGAARGQLVLPPSRLPLALATFQDLIDDLNDRGDIARILEYYAANARVVGGDVCGPTACIGRDAIRRHIESMLSGRTHIDIDSAILSAERVAFRTLVSSDATRVAGIERIVVRGALAFAGDRIMQHDLEFDASDPQTAAFIRAVGAALGGPGGPPRIQAPSTGDGGLVPATGGSSTATALAGVAAVSLLSALLWVRRSRAM